MDNTNLEDIKKIIQNLKIVHQQRENIQKKFGVMVDGKTVQQAQSLTSQEWQRWGKLIEEERELFQKIRNL